MILSLYLVRFKSTSPAFAPLQESSSVRLSHLRQPNARPAETIDQPIWISDTVFAGLTGSGTGLPPNRLRGCFRAIYNAGIGTRICARSYYSNSLHAGVRWDGRL